MSNRWFYDIDGRIGGPLSPMQLQLMVNSGMLQAHHRVRKEDMTAWSPANSVRGLFPDAEPSSAQVPPPHVAVEPAPALPEPDSLPAPSNNAVEMFPAANAFDFFSEPEPVPAPPPPTPKPAPRPTKPGKPAPPSRAKAPDSTPTVDLPVAEPAIVAPDAGAGSNPFAFAGSPTVALAPTPQETDAKSPAPPGKHAADPIPPTPTPASVPEVAGKAVELLPDDTVRLLDGRTNFRLHRAWLLASTKFGDGTVRTAYMRLQRLDGAVLEHRHETGRSGRPPHTVLSFHAGEMTIGMMFQGSEKPYRAFVEKVLVQSNMARTTPAK